MRVSKTVVITCVLLLGASSAFAGFYQPGHVTYTALGTPSSSYTYAFAVSNPGLTGGPVVSGEAVFSGQAKSQAFAWQNGTFNALPRIGTDLTKGGASGLDISGDGSVVVGRDVNWNAVRWEAGAGLDWTNPTTINMGNLEGKALSYVTPNSNFYSRANAISADGTVIVGNSKNATYDSGLQAISYAGSAGPMVGLNPATVTVNDALGISDNGAFIVGQGNSKTQAFILNVATNTAVYLPGTGKALDVTDDGTVAVGVDGSSVACKWTYAGGTWTQTTLSNTWGQGSIVHRISGDGKVLYGGMKHPNGNYAPTLWGPSDITGTLLVSILGAEGISAMSGTDATNVAAGMSPDGTTICGSNLARTDMWIVTLPEPASLLLLGLGGLFLRRRRAC